MSYQIIAAALIAVLTLPSLAEASLVGDEVHATVFNNGNFDVSFPSTIVIDPGIEFKHAGSADEYFVWEADFNSNSVTLIETFNFPSSDATGTFLPTTWTFTDLDWIGQTGEILNVVQKNPSANAPTINSVGPDSFTITLPQIALHTSESMSYTFDIITTHPNVSVPEPSAFAAWSLVAGLAFVVKRRRQLR